MKIKAQCFRKCNNPLYTGCKNNCKKCAFSVYEEVEFDVPKHIERKIKKSEALREKQAVISMQIDAFCTRKGYCVVDFFRYVWPAVAEVEDET